MRELSKRRSTKTWCCRAKVAPTQCLTRCLACSSAFATTLEPGFRNEFHAGFQQAFGRYAVVGGEYIWKYTHNAFDFSVFGNTPVTFPIDWHNSKIPGFALNASVPNFHNFSANVVMSSVAARFFPPQVAGAGATSGVAVGYPFRIDHDERYNQTTHFQYNLPGEKLHAMWAGFNWRYDSGLVAGSAPCYNVTDPELGLRQQFIGTRRSACDTERSTSGSVGGQRHTGGDEPRHR